MPSRLVEQYRVGDAVEILFTGDAAEHWEPGVVVLLQHPGVWVRACDGRPWYVTNGRRIRPAADPAAPAE